MTKTGQFLIASLAVIMSVSAKADVPVFGNSTGDGSGFSLVDYNGMGLEGGAVEFTPEGNFNLSSVTLWLSGYSGQQGQTIDVSIWNNGNNAPGAPIINLESPTANNGSLAAFTFIDPSVNPYDDLSDSTVLSADTSYWLVVTTQGQSGDYMDAASWAGGGTPSGVAVYEGADSYNISGASFEASSALPAFTINDANSEYLQPVPEPASWSLMMVAAFLGMGRAVYMQRKCRLQLVRARKSVRHSCGRFGRF